tara:strand:- start:611 stop:1084 length:474 start_codon:yes stop_codon:yes gene_type:complete
MENQIKSNASTELVSTEFITKVESLENVLLEMNESFIAKGNSELFPLKHSFSEGVYVREMFMEKGGIVIGKIYKISHTWFLLSGKINIATEEGSVIYTAPCYVNAPEGTKRVLHALADSIFVNVYPNPDNITDVSALEDMLTCSSHLKYKEYKLLNN